MAAAYLPAPGTDLGPCVEICSHVDCNATRLMAASICRLCGAAIGYDVGFFNAPSGIGWHHAECVYQEAEAK